MGRAIPFSYIQYVKRLRQGSKGVSWRYATAIANSHFGTNYQSRSVEAAARRA